MAKFINYQNLDFKLNSENFYADKINLSINASVDPVLVSDGSLLDYAPQGSLVGSLSADFYLTGSLPNFLDITGIDSSKVTGLFGGVQINNMYAKSLSFSVEPFQPIILSVGFDWYGQISIQNIKEQEISEKYNKDVPQYIANAYRSSMTNADLDGVGNIVNFSYNSSCDRPAFFKVDEIIPFRVAKLNKKAEISLSSNSLGESVDIDGKIVTTTLTLKDMYNTSLQTFYVSGVMNNQKYEISEGGYLLTSASIFQQVTETKILI
jgi:hypothetical protein